MHGKPFYDSTRGTGRTRAIVNMLGIVNVLSLDSRRVLDGGKGAVVTKRSFLTPSGDIGQSV